MTVLPKAILFDADGTLYDSEPLHYAATRLAALELHDFDLSEELFDLHMRKGSKMGHEVLREQGFDASESDYQVAKLKHFQRLVAENLQLMPGLENFLAWCERQNVATIVVSTSRREQLESALSATGIRDYFTIIVGHEDTVGKKKPDPYPWLRALELAKLSSSDVIAIEDTKKGITSAVAADIRCFGIRNALNDKHELAQAEFIIEDYSELQSYLLR